MSESEVMFKEFPKIYRLNRDIIITEKLDGTNGLIYINNEANQFLVGSHSRWITVDNDNHSFAKWCESNKADLLSLGDGYHYGEFWGNGIQRGYGLPNGQKRFSLFNVHRWSSDFGRDKDKRPKCCETVPVLYQGKYSELAILDSLEALRQHGSFAVPFMNPEGIVIFHIAGNVGFKKTILNDEKPKSLV